MKTVLKQTVYWLILLLVVSEAAWFVAQPDRRQDWLQQLPGDSLAARINPAGRWLWPQVIALLTDAALMPGAVMDSAGSLPGVHAALPQWLNATAPCIKPPTQDITAVQSAAVYRWTDDNGRVHFGDKTQRADADDLSKRYARQTQGIKLTLDYRGWDGDTSLSAALQKESQLLYRILTRYIPKAYWRQINLNLVVFASQPAFEQFKVRQGKDAGWYAYYDGNQNQAFLAAQPQQQATLRVARHEMAHAMMLGMLGSTPIWISEGMAQYLERLQWQLSSASIAADRGAFAPLAQQGEEYFRQLVTISHRDFNASQQTLHYQHAAAMVHFLLGHAEGQQWFSRTLAYFATTPCAPYQPERLFAADYPAGLDGAAQAYQQWLMAGKYRTHYY